MWLERRARNLDSVSQTVSNLSRRDKRAQPGVSTPDTDKKMPRPVGAVEGDFVLANGESDLKLPGVETPGLVLLSLRDKSDTSRRGYIFE